MESFSLLQRGYKPEEEGEMAKATAYVTSVKV